MHSKLFFKKNFLVFACSSSSQNDVGECFVIFPDRDGSEAPIEGVMGVGGLGGLYPAVRRYAKCHHNGSTYEHGEAVSSI